MVKVSKVIFLFKDRGKTIFQDALTGDAMFATVEKGEKIFKLLEDKIIERIEAMQQSEYYE